MNEEEYITSRVNDQIAWYDRKSQSSQRYFKVLRGGEIITAASIPLIAGILEAPFPVTTVVAILGALIVVISAAISLNQFQEHWIEYRTTCESLQHEKFLFLTKSDPYLIGDPFNLFVQRIESIISKENSAWSQYTKTAVEQTKINPVKD